MNRGKLTPEIKRKMEDFLGFEVEKDELRMLPYIDYAIKNSGELDALRMSKNDMVFLKKLKENNLIDHSVAENKLYVSKKFYEFMQEILWEGYVCFKLENS